MTQLNRFSRANLDAMHGRIICECISHLHMCKTHILILPTCVNPFPPSVLTHMYGRPSMS